jgi:plasmid stabilization system protein ParE
VRIRILDLVERDLLEGYGFYDAQDSGLGDYFLDTLFSDIDALKIFAGIHRQVYGHYRLLSGRFPYAVYYTIDEDLVSVWRVLDLRRDPEWIARQLTGE